LGVLTVGFWINDWKVCARGWFCGAWLNCGTPDEVNGYA